MKRLVPVVWVESVAKHCKLLLACGHTVTGSCTIFETVCPACPDGRVGDSGPLDHWTPYKTVRFYPNQSGGVA